MICWKQRIWTSSRHSKCLRVLKLPPNHAKSCKHNNTTSPAYLSTTRVNSGISSSIIKQRLANRTCAAAATMTFSHVHCVHIDKRNATNFIEMVTYRLRVTLLAHNFRVAWPSSRLTAALIEPWPFLSQPSR